MANKPIKMDGWVRELIVDPLGKGPLTANVENTWLETSYGRRYPIVDGIFDLRLLNNELTADQKVWKAGQREYERWAKNLAARDAEQDYFAEIEGVRDVYEAIPIEGRCLDVGGHQGRLRAFLAPGQEYVSCDPFMNVFDDLDKQPNLTKAYRFLVDDEVNFVCCDAEFLPFSSLSFNTVHMRSVIDHFLAPELALNEAYRVLAPNGALVVGLFVHGGRSGKEDIKHLAKEATRAALVAIGMSRFKDHHVWHPTYAELAGLIEVCGFQIEKTHWQKGSGDTVAYILARKKPGLRRLAS